MPNDMTKARAAKIARAATYAVHVMALADAHKIEVEVYSGGGRATPSRRQVRIPPVRGVVSYYVALHEIGHIVGPGRSAPKLEQEANAWQWAIRNAGVPPTPAVSKMIRRCLSGYHARHLRMAERRYVRFPEPDHVFWKLAEIEPHDQWSARRNGC